jgi:hypothetical protein
VEYALLWISLVIILGSFIGGRGDTAMPYFQPEVPLQQLLLRVIHENAFTTISKSPCLEVNGERNHHVSVLGVQ